MKHTYGMPSVYLPHGGGPAFWRAQLSGWTSVPSGRISQPREKRLLPLMVAPGAGGEAPGRKPWRGAIGSTAVSAWVRHSYG